MRERLGYYFGASYRRKHLDRLQEAFRGLYRGMVLDIGGRDRGRFQKPKGEVERWIFADINEDHGPDMVLDVSDMKAAFGDGSLDVVNAMELFEHVERIAEGLDECRRVLKPGGVMILSAPFLHPVHGDPQDFQRWTLDKWTMELERRGFEIEHAEIMGRYFTLLGDMLKAMVNAFPGPLKRPLQLLFPLLDALVSLDRRGWVFNHRKLGKYHGGYFIVARKQNCSPRVAPGRG